MVFTTILLLFTFRSLFYTKVGRVPILFISFKYLIKATNGLAHTHTHAGTRAQIQTHTCTHTYTVAKKFTIDSVRVPASNFMIANTY